MLTCRNSFRYVVRSSSYFAPENIFKEENIAKTVANLRRVKSFQSFSKPPSKKAAVLVPLCIVDGKVSLLYTLRTSHLSSHKGQVSFPGGRHDSSDESLEHTALRETEEELGIDPKDVKVWGTGNYLISSSDTTVLPVIGQILKELDIKNLKVNTNEVEEVFCVSLEDLCCPSNQSYSQFRFGYSMPVFAGGHIRIWGLTAIMTNFFLTSLLPRNVYNHKVKYIKPFKGNSEPKT